MEDLDKKSVSQVIEVLKHCSSEITDKIPKKFMDFLYENSEYNYEPVIDFKSEHWDYFISDEAKVILALIYRDYVVSPEERSKLITKENEKISEENKKLQEKYNVENLFKDRNVVKTENNQEENMQLIEIEKEPWFKKVWKKILSFFGKNK